MRNRTAGSSALADTARKAARPRHLRLVRTVAPCIAFPCLPGCEYTDEAAADYTEDVRNGGHTCTVTVGLVADLAVSVTRWRATTGDVDTPRVELTGVGRQLDDTATTAGTALELAGLLARASELVAEVARTAGV